jgi:hypothetical protein
MKMSLESGVLGALIYKLGFVKLLGFGAALVGAGVMAIVRPAPTRKELFLQALTALAGSLLFGGFAVQAVVYYFTWAAGSYEAIGAIHGLIGAISWGIFGGIAVIRERLAKDPTQLAKDVRNIL